MLETNSRGNQLRKDLVHSHLKVALRGGIALLIGISATLWVSDQALDLATVTRPKAEAVHKLQTGLQQSLVNLRGWISLNDKKFIQNRRFTWESIIYPYFNKLETLSIDNKVRKQLVNIYKLLQDLEMWQWHIEDVAHTPGNYPAHVLLEKQIRPFSRYIFSALQAMEELEVKNLIHNKNVYLIESLIRLRTLLDKYDKELVRYINQGKQANLDTFKLQQKLIEHHLLKLAGYQTLLTDEQLEQFKLLTWSFSVYSQNAEKAILIRAGSQWDIANYLLQSTASPLGKDIESKLANMAISEQEMVQENIISINRISTLMPWLMGGLLVFSTFLAYKAANKGSKKFVDPAIELEQQGYIGNNLDELMHQLQDKQNLNEMCKQAIEVLAQQTGAYSGSIYIVQKENNYLEWIAGDTASLNSKLKQIARGEGLPGRAWDSKELIEASSEKVPETALQSPGHEANENRTLLAIPVLHKGEVTAVIELISRYPLNDFDKAYLSKSAEQIDIAMQTIYQHVITQKALKDTNTNHREYSQLINMAGMHLQELVNDVLDLSKIEAGNMTLNADMQTIYQHGITRKVLKDTNTNHREYSQLIDMAGMHLQELVSDVLDLSKIETGNMTLNPKRFNLSTLLSDCIDLLQPLAHTKEIALTYQEDQCHISCFTDPERLQQCVVNLISNVIRHTQSGSKLGVRCNLLANERIKITIEDNGSGITEELLEKLSDPFVRLSAKENPVQCGGISLSVAKKIIKMMDGDIGFNRVKGKGTIVWLDIAASLNKEAEEISA